MSVICANKIRSIAVVLFLSVFSLLAEPGGRSDVPRQTAGVSNTLSHLPLRFEPNQGQAPGEVRFLTRASRMVLYLTDDGAIVAAASPDSAMAAVRMKFVGAQTPEAIEGAEKLPGVTNYLIGNNRDEWRRNIPQYGKVVYRDAYPGIDVVYYGNGQTIEFDFVIEPGADPEAIELAFEGTDEVRLDGADLLLATAAGDLRLRKPIVYQESNGDRETVAGSYRLTQQGSAVFELGDYDVGRSLVVDPTISYSGVVGPSVEINDIAVDEEGYLYITGPSFGDFLGATDGAFQTEPNTYQDAFVLKLSPGGETIVYSTYLGGPHTGWGDADAGQAIGVGSDHSVYVAGYTASMDFPVANPQQVCQSYGRRDAFIARLNPSGSDLLYSTCLGGRGTEYATGLAVDRNTDAVFVAGDTAEDDWRTFPLLDAMQPIYGGGSYDAFVAKFAADGTALFSTYLGGSGSDQVIGIVTDGAGSAYVAGNTSSTDFPVSESAFQTEQTSSSGFITKIVADGSALAYSTFLGGSLGVAIYAIDVDDLGYAIVSGRTRSPDFPTTEEAFQSELQGWGDAFVMRLPPGERQTVKTLFAVRWKSLDRQYGITTY